MAPTRLSLRGRSLYCICYHCLPNCSSAFVRLWRRSSAHCCAIMQSSECAELEGFLEPLEAIEGQLHSPDPEDEATRLTITEQQLRKTYYQYTIRRASYRIYWGAPACLLVVEGRFHPEDRSIL